MSVKINGKAQEIGESTISLMELIKRNDVKQPDMVSVQLNSSFVKREEYETTIITDGDEVDFLYFMGGGEVI